jgi:Helix-turn-helix family
MDPLVARKTWRTLEPLHGMIYFAPEADEAYTALGLRGNRMGYFASRSAAMGPVTAAVVVATFYNFNPELVTSCIPEAWQLASPAAILDARHAAAVRALRRALPPGAPESPELAEAAGLARRAAEVAAERPAGRPLFAAHAALPWPDEPLAVLWHAQTLLREYRGDAHIASLLLYGVGPVEALVTHGATGDAPVSGLQATRAWPEEAWTAAEDRLRQRGLLANDGTLTEQGTQLREAVEHRTDVAAVGAYEVLGEDGCERLRALCRPLSRAVVSSGGLGG